MYKKETDTHCDSTSVQISSVEHLRKRNKIRERRAGIQRNKRITPQTIIGIQYLR